MPELNNSFGAKVDHRPYVIKRKKWNHLEVGEEGNSKAWRICGALNTGVESKERGRRICQNRAGFKTDHVGVGRCNLHGGCSKPRKELIKHGRRAMAYQDELRRAYIAKANEDELDGDPLDLRAELSIQRDLLYIFLGRQAKGMGIELPNLPVSEEGRTAMDEMGVAETLEMSKSIEIIYNMVNDITKVTNAISTQRKDKMMSLEAFERESLRLQRAVETTLEAFVDPKKRREAVQFFAEQSNIKSITG